MILEVNRIETHWMGWKWIAATLVLCLVLAAAPVGADDSAAGSIEVARVLAVQGNAYATSAGQEPRRLDCDSPIFAGDAIATETSARLSIVSGNHLARIGGASELRFRGLAAGAPDLMLSNGHLRLVEMQVDVGKGGSIETPGLVVADSGGDTEALVFAEKVSVVSMICPGADPVDVARPTGPTQIIRTTPGQCAVAKPREPLYTARASHPKLELLAQDSCEPDGLLIGATDRFTPYDVASMLPPLGPPAVGPVLVPAGPDVPLSCSLTPCTPDGPGFGVSGPAPPVGPPPVGPPPVSTPLGAPGFGVSGPAPPVGLPPVSTSRGAPGFGVSGPSPPLGRPASP